MSSHDAGGMSTFEYHVLLALASGPLHGYAIKDAVADESRRTLTPRAGSLYRVIARLMTSGLVTETEPPDDSHAASRAGAEVLRAERARTRGARGRSAPTQSTRRRSPRNDSASRRSRS